MCSGDDRISLHTCDHVRTQVDADNVRRGKRVVQLQRGQTSGAADV